MEPMKWALQALDIIESETRDLVPAGAPSTPKSETDVEIALLVQQVGTTSIAEIEKMIGELQEAKDFLQSEGERVQRETEHYTTLTQMASASVKIISDTVAKWRARRAIPYETIWVDVEIRGHALPARGRQRFGGRTGSTITVPGTNPSPDPKEEPLKQGKTEGKTGGRG